jgi:hypothetical protein
MHRIGTDTLVFLALTGISICPVFLKTRNFLHGFAKKAIWIGLCLVANSLYFLVLAGLSAGAYIGLYPRTPDFIATRQGVIVLGLFTGFIMIACFCSLAGGFLYLVSLARKKAAAK